LSDPAKENARDKWAELNKEFDALKKLIESPKARKDLDFKGWLKLKMRLISLKYDGLKDIPGPYGKKLTDWYSNLWEVDRLIEEMEDEFKAAENNPDSPAWDTMLAYIETAKKAKERLEKFVE
jgi:hypothetical protein